jgi:hypothetical protein
MDPAEASNHHNRPATFLIKNIQQSNVIGKYPHTISLLQAKKVLESCTSFSIPVGSLTPISYTLKGQCQEMVVEVRPWSGSLALNYGSRTPFSV